MPLKRFMCLGLCLPFVASLKNSLQKATRKVFSMFFCLFRKINIHLKGSLLVNYASQSINIVPRVQPRTSLHKENGIEFTTVKYYSPSIVSQTRKTYCGLCCQTSMCASKAREYIFAVSQYWLQILFFFLPLLVTWRCQLLSEFKPEGKFTSTNSFSEFFSMTNICSGSWQRILADKKNCTWCRAM